MRGDRSRASFALYNTVDEVDALAAGAAIGAQRSSPDEPPAPTSCASSTRRSSSTTTAAAQLRPARRRRPAAPRATIRCAATASRSRVRLEGDRVADVRFEGSGCAISTASASLMTEAVEGKTVDEAERARSSASTALGRPATRRRRRRRRTTSASSRRSPACASSRCGSSARRSPGTRCARRSRAATKSRPSSRLLVLAVG